MIAERTPTTENTAGSVLSISLTEAGRHRAARLPYESVHGSLVDTVAARWHEVDAFVLFCAVGIAVRAIAPLLAGKSDDPSVVAVDDGGRFAVPIVGGHHGRSITANRLAGDVSALLSTTPVITTASDATGTLAFDDLPGFVAEGDVAKVTRANLDGETLSLRNDLGWPVPPAFDDARFEPAENARHTVESSGDGQARPSIVISDRRKPERSDPSVVLRPPSLVVGIGASSDSPAEAAASLLDRVLAEHDLAPSSVAGVATIDRRAGDPVVTTLGLPVRSFTGPQLATVDVPNPSEVVLTEVGTASVAEAAALLAAGPGAELIVEKTKGTTATVAVARRAGPEGSVAVVGLGPGHPRHRTPEAVAAIRAADVIIGYRYYTDQCADLVGAHQVVVPSPIGSEVDRCEEAVERASHGQRVALVCSGDPGVFAMATLVYEVAPRFGSPAIEVVPGVTASLAAASLLGAPLAHDHALLSLSDLLTPWPLIERRLRAVADADMAVALYNPRSQRRTVQLERARDILGASRPATTPVGIVVNATRPNQQVIMTTIGELDPADVDMFSVVVVGSSTTTVIDGAMVTPRGYDSESEVSGGER